MNLCINTQKRIHSSVVEHSLDKRMVSGSSPLGFNILYKVAKKERAVF